jgi:cell division protein FtsB
MQNSNQQIQDLLRRIEQLNYQNLAIKNTIKLLNDEVNELAFKINNADAQSDYLPLA